MSKRFNVNKEKSDKATVITRTITDQNTGVQYLYIYDASYEATGLTVLLDADGKPLLDKN